MRKPSSAFSRGVLTSVLRAALVIVMSAPLAAQERVSLDGEWSLRIETPGHGAGLPAAVAVPGPFEDVLGHDFDGVVRYRRELPLPATRCQRVRVEFAAVATGTEVFCNGRKIGSHLGGWTPFGVDLTDALKWDGDDVLEVRVDEKVGHNTQGFLPVIQPHFGGIWQGVTLCLDDGPVIDRRGVFLFGRCGPSASSNATGELEFSVPVFDGDGVTAELCIVGGREPVSTTAELRGGERFGGTVAIPEVEPWSPENPRLYTVRIRLLDGETELERVERKVGFRSLRADGTRVFWNGSPLQLRGVLHWGYSPPHLAPPVDRAYWQGQIAGFKALGFNCIKCCLWVPPTCFYDLCDELGMLVWQEYPTWHPRMDEEHRQELLDEYGEFFVHDRSHPSVAFRSITCETGHGADFEVVKALFNACKAAVPDTLVVDDSSWIGWQRITDFWDEHPYGNNSWFPGRLGEFKRHIAEKGAKPLLLGECLAGDTWCDLGAWTAEFGDDKRHEWHRPICWESQVAAERWIEKEFGRETLDSLLPLSMDFAHRNRKFQIEQLRLGIPDAGYVVSVARDIPKCRMGLSDCRGVMKWTAADWAWHRDTMLCLDLPWNGRAQPVTGARAPVRVSHFGPGLLDGQLRIWSEDGGSETSVALRLAPGQNSEPVLFALPDRAEGLRRVRVTAELTGSHPARNAWDLWLVPASEPRAQPGVIEATELTTDLLEKIESGARVLLHAGDRKGAVRSEALWFLRGGPFAPPHPIHDKFPVEALLDLASFDLESGRLIPWAGWKEEVDPILAFWETHDIPEVRFHLLAFDTRIGKGRLLATTLNLGHEEASAPPAGDHLRSLLREHLGSGPPARRALSPATIHTLRLELTEKKIALPTWRFRIDPDDKGRSAKWQDPATDVSTADWRDIKAGSHWENQGEELKHYTGVAWYRVDVEVPADWRGLDARAVFEGVDDSFACWVNGKSVGRFGDPATGTTIWLERQVADVSAALRPGAVNTIVLRVVDHAGAGGLWKPVFLTTGPADGGGRLVR